MTVPNLCPSVQSPFDQLRGLRCPVVAVRLGCRTHRLVGGTAATASRAAFWRSGWPLGAVSGTDQKR